MKPVLGRRPSAALVIACVALFVSLGGVSWGVATGFIDGREILDNTIRTQDIRDNTIRAQDLRNNEVRSTDIRNSTILGRDVGLDTLTGSDIDESRLAQVPDAAALGGVAAGSYLRADTTGFALLAPAPGWSGAGGEPAAGYDVDPTGYVHLRGVLETDGENDTALILPAGARPATRSRFIVWRSGPSPAVELTAEPDGDVIVPAALGGQDVALDGVTFRAG